MISRKEIAEQMRISVSMVAYMCKNHRLPTPPIKINSVIYYLDEPIEEWLKTQTQIIKYKDPKLQKIRKTKHMLRAQANFVFKPGQWDCFDSYRVMLFCKSNLRVRLNYQN